MATERERELEQRVEELEREADMGWNLFWYGLPLALVVDALGRRSRRREAQRRRQARERFEAWLDALDDRERSEIHAVLEQGLPIPADAQGDFALGFDAHNDVMRSLVRERALRQVARADDARELLEAGGIRLEDVSVEWLRGFQAANAALAQRFGPA